jgi:hypothetical protein
MDVPTITMDPEEAAAKIAAWMNEKHADQAEVKKQCIAGYEALAAGKTLLQLDVAIRGGGFHANGFPKLAIARADRREVAFAWRSTENIARYDTRDRFRPGRQSATLLRQVDMGRQHGLLYQLRDGSSYGKTLEGFSQVPLLPAERRPETGQLRDWFILWEVERWYASSSLVQPDRDPMLLEHVAAQLYAVLAEWELTELERAVMAGALRPEA